MLSNEIFQTFKKFGKRSCLECDVRSLEDIFENKFFENICTKIQKTFICLTLISIYRRRQSNIDIDTNDIINLFMMKKLQ